MILAAAEISATSVQLVIAVGVTVTALGASAAGVITPIVLARIASRTSLELAAQEGRLKLELQNSNKVISDNVKDVKIDLAARDEKTDDKLTKIHKLVNGRFGTVLRALAASERRNADATGLPADIATANEAETAYDEHMRDMMEAEKNPGS